MTGTLLNVVTVLLGATLGTLLGTRFPVRVRETVMGALGIMTIVLGLTMAISGNALIVLASLLLGGVIGEFIRIDDRLNALGGTLERRLERQGTAGNFTKGFVTASLVFCVGPLTILGSIQDGLLGDYRLLAIKSLLDGFAGLAFASTLGIGVAFAALTVLIFQGSLSLAAMFVGSALGSVSKDTAWVVQLTATGGALMVGIGLLLLDLKRLRVANYLPAILLAPLIQTALGFLHIGLP